MNHIHSIFTWRRMASMVSVAFFAFALVSCSNEDNSLTPGFDETGATSKRMAPARVINSASEVNRYLNSWMGLYPDNYPLYKMLLPGTHDAEAVVFSFWSRIGTPWGQCQETHVADQLEHGVRALDIRLRPWYGTTLYVAHGILNTDVEMVSNVMRPIVNFLKNHPSESIVLMLKDEGTPSGYIRDWQKLVAQVVNSNEFAPYIVKDVNPNTKLSDVRGRIVLLTRYNLNGMTSKGNDFIGWRDNTTANIRLRSYATNQYTEVAVQDVYKGISTSAKVEYVKKSLWASAGQLENGRWTISFSSLEGNPGINAKSINPELVKFFNASTQAYSGIIYTDFITRDAAQGPQLMNAILWNQIRHQLQ